MMFLDERKRRILHSIIDDYIDTAEPIGSRTVARKYEIGLSSATIRNEMADLEEMGYLAQPHTSAGRIPSDKGYRLYVNELMNKYEMQPGEVETIKEALQLRINVLGDIIKHASNVLSRITKYTSIAAVKPQSTKITIRAVQVVPVESGKALVLVVTSTGVVRNGIVRIPESMTPDILIKISVILNNKLTGLSQEQIVNSIISDIEKETGILFEVVTSLVNSIKNCLAQIDNPELFMDGATNFLNFPEFKDIAKAKELLSLMDAKDIIAKLLHGTGENGDIKVLIGSENDLDEIKECSLVVATYNMSDTVLGSIGIIGPTRMEYSRVISSLNYIRKLLNRELLNLIGKDAE